MFGVMDEFGLIRQSSIDNEPRTLNITQIDFAREAAIYVVNTRSTKEALDIFTEGLEASGVVKCEVECISDNGSYKWNNDNDNSDTERTNATSKSVVVRDIVSAPF